MTDATRTPALVDGADRQPGLPEPHQWRPTDVDPKAEKRAERQVADAVRACRSFCVVLFVVAYFAFDIGDDPDTIGGLGASNVALGLTLGLRPAAHRHRHDPVGPQADGRPRDRRDAPPAPLLRRGPRGDARASSAGPRGVRHRPAPAGPQHAARRGRPARPARRSCCCATSARCPGDEPTTGWHGHHLGDQGMRVVRDVVGTPIKARRHGDRRAGQRRARRRSSTSTRTASPELEGVELQIAKAKAAVILRPDGARRHHPGTGPRELGASTASSATPRSAPTSAARSRCTSSRPTTCSARATSRPSTWPTAPRSSSARPPGRCRSCRSTVDDEGYLVAQSDFTEPVGPSFWERD